MGMVIIFVLFLCNTAFTADIYMKIKTHTDGFEMMGQKQPAQDLIQEVWMTKDRISTSSKEQASVILLDKKVMYIINHTKKTYMEMPMDFSKMMPDADDAEMKGMMQNMMKVKISVTPTEEKKKINKWNCKKYIQKIETFMGPMNMEVWASEDIKIDQNLYLKYASSMFSQMPGMQAYIKEIEKEMKKIKGVTVLSMTDMAVMGQSMKSSTELLEVKEGKAPAKAFEIPKGYKKTKMEGMPFEI